LGKIIFVTGTDTGVGKTLLTVSLVWHLRQGGIDAVAMKPFCSGGRQDVDAIQSVQEGRLSDEEANPFYFSEPVAPLVAARQRGQQILLGQVVNHVHRMTDQCERLIVEGSGGLLVPLGEDYTVADLIGHLHCEVVVVGRNKLGTINHTLLTVRELQSRAVSNVKVVLMNGQTGDASKATNLKVLRELLAPVPVFNLPYLGPNPLRLSALKNNRKKIKKVLAQIVD